MRLLTRLRYPHSYRDLGRPGVDGLDGHLRPPTAECTYRSGVKVRLAAGFDAARRLRAGVSFSLSLIAAGGAGVAFDLGGVGLELLGLPLLRTPHRLLDLGAHVSHTDNNQPRLSGV